MSKPWPSDAIMVVSALAGQENRANMEGVFATVCRDCGRTVHADTFTVRTATQMPIRRGRPVKFFCTECCIKYDFHSITHLTDHSGVTGRIVP